MRRPELTVVTTELPEPPYPKSTKANGYEPRVDWQRIRASRTWRTCPPDLRSTLLRLWLESWNEVPAGSWEADDELIAAAIDMPFKAFQVHRDELLRGWVRHSDGRLYHPYITAQVLNMLDQRASLNERQRRFREKSKKQSVTEDVTRDKRVSNRLSPVSNATEKEKEKEKEKINPPMSPPAGKPAFVLPAGVDPGTWADFEAHRREIRKPLTDLARRTNVKVLVGLPPKQQREVVDTSIANRWVGLFPPKTKTPTPKKDRETYL